jgi:hypothetical protein
MSGCPTTFKELEKCPGWTLLLDVDREYLVATTATGEGAELTSDGRLSLSLCSSVSMVSYPRSIGMAEAVRLAHGFINLFAQRSQP